MTDTEIAVVCAWCGTSLREGSGEQVSHGVCAACSSTFLREARRHTHGPSFERRRRQRRRHRWSGFALLGATLAPVVLAEAWRRWGARFSGASR